MVNFNKKYMVQLPAQVHVIYSKKKRFIVLKGSLNTKIMKVYTQLILFKTVNVIQITPFSFFKISKNSQKKMKSVQGTITAMLKQYLIETSIIFYKKLKFTGVGYWVFDVTNFETEVFMFKLGFAHFIYFKASIESKIFCFKSIQLFIFGNSYQTITQIASLIRSYKKPEPYKGKGILYESENIRLKEGKKS